LECEDIEEPPRWDSIAARLPPRCPQIGADGAQSACSSPFVTTGSAMEVAGLTPLRYVVRPAIQFGSDLLLLCYEYRLRTSRN
jgi:hypothetical protein